MTQDALREQAQEQFDESAAKLEERLSDQDFLANRGLGNEVGIHVFCYDPMLELQARKLFARLRAKADSGAPPCRIIERNLYDILIDICKEKRIFDSIPRQEEKRGTQALVDQLQKVATPSLFAQKLVDERPRPGDVLLITGVGEVYPVLRAHVLLDNLQPLISETPVIVAYPGIYNGQTLQLFAGATSRGSMDGNYYRAFRLV